MEVTFALGAEMLVLGGVAGDLAAAQTQLERVVADGSALAKFGEIVAAQGGDARVIDDPTGVLPSAAQQVPFDAPRHRVARCCRQPAAVASLLTWRT